MPLKITLLGFLRRRSGRLKMGVIGAFLEHGDGTGTLTFGVAVSMHFLAWTFV
jgi:hypothetical protein